MELHFNKELHRYFIGNKRLPSVTEIIAPISDKYYNDLFGKDKKSKEESEFIKNMAGKKGDAVHFAIELYNETGVLEIEDKYKGYLDAYLKFAKDYENRIKIIYSEIKTHHKNLMYAGTIDAIAKFDDKIIMIDYKTTSELVHLTVDLQLPAYKEAYNSWKKDNLVEECYVLHLEKDGNYTFEEVKDRFDIFLKLLDIYNYYELNKGDEKNE